METNSYLNTFYSIRRFVWNCLFILVYPVITTFSFLFVGIVWIFSQLSTLLSKIGTSKSTILEFKKPEWTSLSTVGHYRMEKLFVDDILFGPTYYKLKTNPALEVFDEVFFGDFTYKCFDGILLQRWNTTTWKELPDFSLMFFNGSTGELTEIKRIRSFSWNAYQLNENEVKLKWFSGTEGGELIINKQNLNYTQVKID